MKLKALLCTIFILIASTCHALNQVQLGPEYIPNPSIGRALSLADIYVGEPDTDPEIVGNQKQISVQQEDGSIVTVSQPISTGAGGVPLYNGSPVVILVEGNYSLKILDSGGSQIYYTPSDLGITENTLSFYGCDLALAVSEIGATLTTLYIDCETTIPDGTTVTIAETTTLHFLRGGLISGVVGGGTETLAGNTNPIADKTKQIYGDNVVVSGLTVLYPEWWGATNDGIDSSAAIDRFLLSLNQSGGEVIFDIGTYSDDGSESALTHDNITFSGQGWGTILKTWYITADSYDNLIFKDLKIDESVFALNFTDCDDILIDNVNFAGHTTNNAPRGVQAYGTRRLRVVNSNFNNFQYGIWLREIGASRNNQDTFISNCKFTSDRSLSFPAGVCMTNGVKTVITNCVFEDITTSNLSYGIYQGDNVTYTSEDITVSNCVMDNMTTAVRIHNADRVTVSGITGLNLIAYGVFIDGDVDPVGGADQTDITISGCTFDGRITIGDTATNVAITGNTVDGAAYGVHIVGSVSGTVEHVTIQGNIFKNLSESGIGLTYCNHVTIDGNQIIDANTDNDSAGTSLNNACISAYSNADYIRVTNNLLKNTGTGLAHYGINFQSLTNSPNRYYFGNEIISMVTSNIRNPYTAAPTTGNWEIGDRIYDASPTASGVEGWICTVAGNPGTWVTFGVLGP